MKWKALLSHPNTRVTVVEEKSKLADELQKAMDAIELIEEMDELDILPVAVKVEVLKKEEKKSWETLFPIDWWNYGHELNKHFSGIELSREENVAVGATLVFPDKEEHILLVCESEFMR